MYIQQQMLVDLKEIIDRTKIDVDEIIPSLDNDTKQNYINALKFIRANAKSGSFDELLQVVKNRCIFPLGESYKRRLIFEDLGSSMLEIYSVLRTEVPEHIKKEFVESIVDLYKLHNL